MLMYASKLLESNMISETLSKFSQILKTEALLKDTAIEEMQNLTSSQEIFKENSKRRIFIRFSSILSLLESPISGNLL